MVSVTKIMGISYAHYLPDYKGKCATMHGHNAKIELEFKDTRWSTSASASLHNGKHTQMSGMVIDFSYIKEMIESKVMDQLDHKNLNEEVSFFNIFRPTAENICILVKSIISKELEGMEDNNAILTRVRVWEDSDSYAEWKDE